MDVISHNENRTKQGRKQPLYGWFILGQKELEVLSVIHVEWTSKLYQDYSSGENGTGERSGEKNKFKEER